MPRAIRYAVIIPTLNLVLAGCAGPQRSESFSRPVRPPSAVQTAAIVADGGISRQDALIGSYGAEPSAPGPQHDITLDQIRAHVHDETVVLIDARNPEDFARGHVRGALNLPAGPVEQMEGYLTQMRPSMAPDQLIVLYCSGPRCGSGDMVSEYLADRGFTNMRVYSPGWQMLATAKDLQ